MYLIALSKERGFNKSGKTAAVESVTNLGARKLHINGGIVTNLIASKNTFF
jgi:hypothetical protein